MTKSRSSKQKEEEGKSSVEGEVLTMRLEPGTTGSPEESLATRLFTPEEGESMEPYT